MKNASPQGYILRIVLYIKAAQDVKILLSTSNHPNFRTDFVYEFGNWLKLPFILIISSCFLSKIMII